MEHDLLKPEEVAKRLGMSLSWVYGHKYEIGFIQFGSAVRFDYNSVEEYAQRCRRGPQEKEDQLWDIQSHKGKTVVPGSSGQQSTAVALNELFKQKERQDSTL